MNASRILSLLAVVMLAGADAPAAAATSEPPAVVVNGRALAVWEAERELSNLIGATRFHGSVDPDRMAELRREALDSLVRKELRARWAEANGIAVDDAEMKSGWRKIHDRFPDDEAYRSAIAAKGISHDAFLAAFWRDAAAAAAERARLEAIAPPTATELAEYYDAHRSDYVKPEQRELVLALFYLPPSADSALWEAALEDAHEAARSITSGDVTLVEVAAKLANAIPPRYLDRNGKLGFVHRGALGEPLDTEVFNAAVDAVVGPVRSLLGYNLAQVTAVRPPQQLALEAVRDAVVARLVSQRQDEAMARFDAQLAAAAEIEEGTWVDAR